MNFVSFLCWSRKAGNHDKSMKSMFSFLINSKFEQNISTHSEVLLKYIIYMAQT